jgi:transmembrane sensor
MWGVREYTPDDQPDLDLDLVERYFSGSLPPGEATRFERSLAESPARRAAVEQLRDLWDIYRVTPNAWDMQAMWSAIAARTGVMVSDDAVAASIPSADAPTPRPSTRRRAPHHGIHASPPARVSYWRRWRSVAAVVAVCVAGGVWARQAWVASHRADDVKVASSGTWKRYVSPRGQRATIQLQDGSKIVLAAESELRVRQGGGREVELSGEAFFDVAHDVSRPFVVRTARGVITELGTSFAVQAYPADTQARVVVVSGRVQLSPLPGIATSRGSDTMKAVVPPRGYPRPRGFSGAIVLAAGDMAITSPDGAIHLAHNVDPRDYTSWVNGEFRFVNTPLDQVVKALQRWYDVKIVMADAAFATYPLTVSIRGGSVDDAMEVVTKSLGLRFEWRNGAIWIVGQNNS